jgi:hypothetical protein
MLSRRQFLSLAKSSNHFVKLADLLTCPFGLGNRDCRADHATSLYPQKLALASPTSCVLSVGIVPSRTQAMEFFFLFPCPYEFTTASVVQWPEFLASDPEVRVRFPALPEKK